MSISELKVHFGAVPALDDEAVVAKLQSLLDIFNTSVEDLYIKWEQYVNRVGEDVEVSASSLDAFQTHLQSAIAKQTPQVKKTSGKRSLVRPGFSSSPAVPSTPSVKKRRVDEVALDLSPAAYETANSSFDSPLKKKEAHESHTVVELLNPHIADVAGHSDPDTKACRLGLNFDPAKYKFRTMSMKLLESADVLDEQIDMMGQLYADAHPGTAFGNPCISSQLQIVCCGRIVPDLPTYDTLAHSLNDKSLYLETLRTGGIGQRIPLDVSALAEFSFFPGQIVVLEGSNPTGRAFVVAKNHALPALGAPLSSEDELGTAPLRVVVAAGPYSPQQLLDYSKLDTLVGRINTVVQPHVVVMYGPFLDIENKAVASGDLDHVPGKPKSLDDVFKHVISPILKKINPHIQVVLVPSLRDSCIKHVSYPQDLFDRKKLGLPKNVKVFPNPSGFAINEVMVGGSNLDIYKDLREVFRPTKEGSLPANRFDRITHHVFDQRRYYPVFPGSIRRPINKESAELLDGLVAEELACTTVGGSSLEVPYLGLTELGDTLPDVLVLPSELKPFAKVVRGVVVINPGSFVRPTNDPLKQDGTYAVMNIRAPEVGGDDNVEPAHDGLYYHNVYKRARVDVVRS